MKVGLFVRLSPVKYSGHAFAFFYILCISYNVLDTVVQKYICSISHGKPMIMNKQKGDRKYKRAIIRSQSELSSLQGAEGVQGFL
jgi:hypothetical protein